MKIIRPFLIARPLIIGIVATTFLLFSARNAVALDQLNSLSAFEDECQKIGFTPKTEKFGECVLTLLKRTLPSSTEKAKQSGSVSGGSEDKFVAECTKMGFREGTLDSSNCALSLRKHHAELDLHQQQLQSYQRQVDQAEKSNRLDETLRLLEIANQGFSMAAGNSSALTSSRNTTPLPLAPKPLHFLSPSGNRFTCSYSGVQLVCR